QRDRYAAISRLFQRHPQEAAIALVEGAPALPLMPEGQVCRLWRNQRETLGRRIRGRKPPSILTAEVIKKHRKRSCGAVEENVSFNACIHTAGMKVG
ncbi:hypothetical protein, partial [Aliiruegeria sabulilitoris]|uniref:hypothetical protein n=1 Tax=Aliiruegeria sabulilitoris TaxID=1510458 RepID=UPI001E2AA64F